MIFRWAEREPKTRFFFFFKKSRPRPEKFHFYRFMVTFFLVLGGVGGQAPVGGMIPFVKFKTHGTPWRGAADFTSKKVTQKSSKWTMIFLGAPRAGAQGGDKGRV